MSQHTYTSAYPANTAVKPGIKQFFEDFYRLSDMAGEDMHPRYVEKFRGDAEFIVGSKRCKGSEEILQARKAMWTSIASRLHTPSKIFPFGPDSNEVMIMGTVVFGLKDGRTSEVEWAGHAKLVEEAGEWRMTFYQVYLDSAAAQANAR